MTEKSKIARSQAERKSAREMGKMPPFRLFMGIIISAILLAGAGWYFLSFSPQSNHQQSLSANAVSQLLSGSPPSRGSPSASVTIVEFGDFQCPTCGKWFKVEEPQVLQKLVETGKAKMEWRDLAIFGPDSTTASEAAYAAGEQGKFWQMYDLLFSNQQTPNNGWANRENVVKLAQQLGLNMTGFNNVMQSGKYVTLINANIQLAKNLGANETPTFFVIGSNGRNVMIAGDQPSAVFETAVNSVVSSS